MITLIADTINDGTYFVAESKEIAYRIVTLAETLLPYTETQHEDTGLQVTKLHLNRDDFEILELVTEDIIDGWENKLKSIDEDDEAAIAEFDVKFQTELATYSLEREDM